MWASIVRKLADRLIKYASGRPPSFVIGKSEQGAYLLRWYMMPRNRFFNIYLHRMVRDDDDRALHDHPWPSVSLSLRGQCIEHMSGGRSRVLKAGSIVGRSSLFSHRLALHESSEYWTLFITGPRLREWGFHCPQGWRHWKDFVAVDDTGAIGKGCD